MELPKELQGEYAIVVENEQDVSYIEMYLASEELETLYQVGKDMFGNERIAFKEEDNNWYVGKVSTFENDGYKVYTIPIIKQLMQESIGD